MAGFAPLVGECFGVERASIQISHDGDRHFVKVGDLIDAEFQDEVHEGASGPVQLIGTGGLPFGPPTTIAPPTKSIINAFGMEIDNSGRFGTHSTFGWTN
jgi:hypothetical protein